MSEDKAIWSIGHSTLSYEKFILRLREAGITAVADVRSAPYSRHQPQFNREELREELRRDGVAYSFLGDELGGRPKGEEYFCEGIADYERMAEAPAFSAGLTRLIQGKSRFRIALMCSEHDPLDCHRCLLVGRALRSRGIIVKHILTDGRQKTQSQIEQELLAIAGQDSTQDDMFASQAIRLNAAYRARSRRVAYSKLAHAGRAEDKASASKS